ncbi:MAG TPA: amidohydrolase [Microscillaceae bacterium]|nr:amidohydrolase [Microscillaceae bacterium]
MSSQKIIDVWMQHPTQRFINHPMFDSLRQWVKLDKVTQDIPAQVTVGALDAAQVDKGLICSWYNAEGALISNEEVAQLVSQYPDRFVGIASVPLNKPVPAIRELRRCVQELHFKGLRIVQWLWNLPPTHAYYYPLFAECVQLDIPVCLQVGHTGPLMPSEVGRPIPYIDQIALDFPDLKIVCGHIGYPWTTEMIAVATKHKNVYIDTSAYAANRFPAELVAYMKAHGKHKVLFGTNYPMITPAKCLQDLGQLQLSEEVTQKFLYENAMRVFALDKA